MKRDDRVRLLHMLDASRKALAFIENSDRQDLETDDLLSFGVVRALEIIGEAAKQVSEDLKNEYPEVKWTETAATRNRLIHGYFDVDLDIVWSILKKDLPQLIEQLEAIL
jgi:uncharacterized protein with HEPN domain